MNIEQLSKYPEPQKLGLYLGSIKIEETKPNGTSIVDFDSQSFCHYLDYYYTEGTHKRKEVVLEGFKPILRHLSSFKKSDAKAILEGLGIETKEVSFYVENYPNSGLGASKFSFRSRELKTCKIGLYVDSNTPTVSFIFSEGLKPEEIFQANLILCKLGFDVFNWIEQGKAVEKKPKKKQ